jgi:tetratricopeptide (TPR) repeat protein
MAVTTEKDLTPPLKATWLKALSAIQLKNHGYAIKLLQDILKAQPSFLSARQLCRKSAVANTANKKGILGGLSGASFSSMKIQGLLKKDPKAALEPIEKALEQDPYNQQINFMLRDAAMALEMPETASFALECAVEGSPKDTKLLHELAKHYLTIQVPDKAVETYRKILEINPSDLVAVKGEKDASARASMQRGGWEREETTYRELIRDVDQAVSLEQQGRATLDEDAIDEQLAELHTRIEANPENFDDAKRIAALYEQRRDLENAIKWIEYCIQLTGGSDHALIRRASDLRIRQYDEAIAQWQEYAAGEIGEEERLKAEKQTEELVVLRAGLLIDEARKRVERNPTDLALRFELAEILYNIGEFQEAIPELQKARQNPNVRIRAMSLLGRCFQQKGMLDLAAKTLTDASSELPTMDSVKKEIVYQLGLVYAEMNEAQKSIDCMKQIYEVDYGYRDVAARVEGSYTNA